MSFQKAHLAGLISTTGKNLSTLPLFFISNKQQVNNNLHLWDSGSPLGNTIANSFNSNISPSTFVGGFYYKNFSR